jgi:hypothetical protein
MAYTYRGDVFMSNLKTGVTTRVTQTEDQEAGPKFIEKGEWLVFIRNQNLYAWNPKTGITKQLSNITKANPTPDTPKVSAQDQFLKQQQLEASKILTERKNKRDERTEYLKTHGDMDTLRVLALAKRTCRISRSVRTAGFITYRLFQAPMGTKQAIVPDYVAESGYTTDINARTKVGALLGKYEFYIYDRSTNKLMKVVTDSIPGIKDAPDYVKDYPVKFAQ